MTSLKFLDMPMWLRIIGDFLDLTGFIRLDTALCNHDLRVKHIQQVQRNPKNIHKLLQNNGQAFPYSRSRFGWMYSRGYAVDHMFLTLELLIQLMEDLKLLKLRIQKYLKYVSTIYIQGFDKLFSKNLCVFLIENFPKLKTVESHTDKNRATMITKFNKLCPNVELQFV